VGKEGGIPGGQFEGARKNSGIKSTGKPKRGGLARYVEKKPGKASTAEVGGDKSGGQR